MTKQIDKKEFTKGVISTVVVESQHLDPERVLDTVHTLVSSRDLIAKSGKSRKSRKLKAKIK